MIYNTAIIKPLGYECLLSRHLTEAAATAATIPPGSISFLQIFYFIYFLFFLFLFIYFFYLFFLFLFIFLIILFFILFVRSCE
jgi:hypothetical protein